MKNQLPTRTRAIINRNLAHLHRHDLNNLTNYLYALYKHGLIRSVLSDADNKTIRKWVKTTYSNLLDKQKSAR